ncbi:hypothetical protein CK203_113133 [Vitis vinifera]|uniref:Uncharacterized protein n=1 Tax=Vitis vinifera TaxID=29760 RepID=A0A438BMX8_VITVI|nr:hypothetical protein CK203_113133 [Vitis vinifera]
MASKKDILLMKLEFYLPISSKLMNYMLVRYNNTSQTFGSLYDFLSEAERVVHPEMEAGCMAGSDQKIGWCRMYVSIIFVVLLMVCLIIGKLDAEGTSGSSASGEHNSLAGCVYSA